MHREHLPETKSREASTLERNQNCFFLFSRFLIFACPYCKQETVLRVFGAVCAEIRTTGFKLFSPQTPLCVAGRLGRGEKRAHRPSRACYLFIIAILLNTQAAIAQCLSNKLFKTNIYSTDSKSTPQGKHQNSNYRQSNPLTLQSSAFNEISRLQN